MTKANSLDDLLKASDYITVHVPYIKVDLGAEGRSGGEKQKGEEGRRSRKEESRGGDLRGSDSSGL
jgi:hypothetical protein